MYNLRDYFLAQKVVNLEAAFSEVSSETSRTKLEAELLRETVDRLVLAFQAMWDLVGTRAGLDDEDLLEKIRELDLSDGVLDGKVRRSANLCPGCKRRNGPRRAQCLYCGGRLEPTAFP